MEKDKATRIYIALQELVSVAEGLNKQELYPNNQYIVRLDKLIQSTDYKEFKDWLDKK